MAEITLAKIATMADVYYGTRAKRLELKHQLDDMKRQEDALQIELISILKNQEVDGVQGKVCRVSLKPFIQPLVVDWDKYDEYILSEGDLSLLERRMGVSAIRERWDAGEEVPGVKEDHIHKLGINKI